MSRLVNASTPAGRAAILRRLERAGFIEAYYGQSGWVFRKLPSPAVKSDVLALIDEGRAQVHLGRLMTPEAIAKDQAA